MRTSTDLKSDFEFYASALMQATGRDRDELLKRRSYPLPYYRAMVARSLRELGYTTLMIGEALNRDHSTIIYNLKQLDDALTNPTFGDIRAMWQDYQSVIQANSPQEAEVESEFDKLAAEFVGKHCRRNCSCCRIDPSECRYLQDERLFKAGGEAYKKLISESLEELRTKFATCSLLCGHDETSEAIAKLEAIINK